MIDQIQFAKRLRGLVRRSDNYSKDRQTILEELIMMAEEYEFLAEQFEKRMILENQLEEIGHV